MRGYPHFCPCYAVPSQAIEIPRSAFPGCRALQFYETVVRAGRHHAGHLHMRFRVRQENRVECSDLRRALHGLLIRTEIDRVVGEQRSDLVVLAGVGEFDVPPGGTACEVAVATRRPPVAKRTSGPLAAVWADAATVQVRVAAAASATRPVDVNITFSPPFRKLLRRRPKIKRTSSKRRHPRESGDPSGLGPRFRGDDVGCCLNAN